MVYGTTVIAVINSDSAVLGADSRGEYKMMGEKKGVEFKIRKIYETNKIVYAFTELKAIYSEDKEIYDAEKIMDGIIKQDKELIKSFNSFNSAIINKLNIAIDSLKNDNQTGVLELYTRKSILSFIMTTSANGQMNYATRSYRLKKDSAGRFKPVVDTLQKTPASHQYAIILGQRMEVNKHLATNPYYLSSHYNIKEKIVCLIKLEADKNPDHVSMPVDIVVVDKRSIRWSYNNNECAIVE
jgi:hypothetical protein